MIETERINVRGLLFNNITLDEAVKIACDHIDNGDKPAAVYTPNAEIAQVCTEDAALREIINSAELVIPDGAGVVLAAKILGRPLKGKVAGIDLGERLLCEGAARGWKIYFLGGRPGIAECAAKKLSEKYPGIIICGTHDGYFDKKGEENDKVVAQICEASPDILFVCLGAPAQEYWIAQNKDSIPSLKLCLGLGGSLDIYSGQSKRAPKIFINLKLEWFYRLLCEPRRIGRMMNLPRFIIGTYRDKSAEKNNKRV